MRDFFGELHCACLSFDLTKIALTAPDDRMEVTAHLVVCVDCSEAFYEPADFEAMPSAPTGGFSPAGSEGRALLASKHRRSTMKARRKIEI